MVDRISSLPDELLCHIISFLPTQQAIFTSVLSKRWRPLWNSVPVLDYDEQIYLRNHNKPSSLFEKFVFSTIIRRDGQIPIKTFRLKYSAHVNNHFRSNAHVNYWVTTALYSGIENLDIELFPQKSLISLDSCNFSCRTLVILKLKGLSMDASPVKLPLLKSLHVEHVGFPQPHSLMKFLNGCPMLEDLKALYLHYAHVFFHKGGCQNLPKLVRADLHLVGQPTKILLKVICNVEFLRIQDKVIALHDVHEFPHLRHLDLFLVHQDCPSMLLMLKKFPKLQSLILRGSFVDRVPSYSYFVPQCLTSCFTKCCLERYRGTRGDMQFAKYIMQNSTSLLSMKIRSSKHKVPKELVSCPRKSASCELSFNRQVFSSFHTFPG